MSVYDDLLRSYRQRQDLAKHADAMRRVMNPLGSTLEGLRQMQEAYERTRRLYAGPADYVRELQEKLQFLQTLQMPRYEAELANWLRLQSGLSQSGVSDVAIRQLATTSTLQMQKALQDITAQLNRPSLNGFPAKLQSVLYSPPLAYSSFARRSIESAAQETREKSQVTQASVVLAESQVEDGTHILTAALEGMDESVGEPSDSEETTVAAVDSDTLEMPAAETLFSTQQTELLAAAGDLSPMSEYETLLANSPTAHQLQLAHELCQLVVDLNQARKLISEEELFPCNLII